MEDMNEKVVATMRFLYSDSGLTLTEIARRTGMSRPTVFRVINGKRELTLQYFVKLCDVFNVKPSKILEALGS